MKFFLIQAVFFMAAAMEFVYCRGPTTPPTRECMKEGIICTTCLAMGICAKMPDGTWQVNDPTTCTAAFPCDEVKGGCLANGICRYGPFVCPRPPSANSTDFPDPYNCHKYYTCDGVTATQKDCNAARAPSPQAWDPKARKCMDEGDLCKDYPVPLCEKEGQSGVIPGTSYSYKCSMGYDSTDNVDCLYPRLQFNATDSPTQPTTTSQQTANTTPLTTSSAATSSAGAPSTTTPTTSAATTPTTSPATTPGYKCASEGYFADPTDCKCYFVCISTGGGNFMEGRKCCRAGSHFDPGQQRCVAGSNC